MEQQQGPQMFTVRLDRHDSSVSWGFRLQGGSDFSTPLSVQLVQPNSIAERAGLNPGDGVLQINNTATECLDHEAAKMEIIRAGNEVEFLIQRGAVTTWRPSVTPMSQLKPSELQTHALPGEAPPVQKTSLAANKQQFKHIGSAHNRSAKPFGAGGSSIEQPIHTSIRDSFPDAAGHPSAMHRNQLQNEYLDQCTGGIAPPAHTEEPTGTRPGVVHAQFNTPLGIYSNKNMEESFNQQATALKDEFGSMSMNPGKAEISTLTINNNVAKNGQVSPALSPNEDKKSAVLRALEQEDEPGLYKGGNVQSRSFKMLEQELETGQTRNTVFSGREGSNSVAGVRSVQSPKTNPNHTIPAGPRYKQPTSKCYVCDQLITGVFVRVKEHCLHSDCLRCYQCKRSLKNIGYIWVADKIYCVQHARELTRPPGGGYTAYVVDAPTDGQ